MLRTLFILLMLLTGCAAYPDQIRPTYVSEVVYKGWTCEELATEYAILFDRLVKANEAQNSEANADFLGVLFILIPAGLMGGADLEPQIGLYKGSMETIMVLSERQGCGITRYEPSMLREREVQCTPRPGKMPCEQ